jgi:hypothetical protein
MPESGAGQQGQAAVRGVSQRDLDNWFAYHAPTSVQLPKYAAIRDAGKDLAAVILEHTPPGPDQTAAIRKIREAVMTANQAIACDNPI